MKKTLIIDRRLARDNEISNPLVLLPGPGYYPKWSLPFKKHRDFNLSIVKAKKELASHFAKTIYAPKLGYSESSCEHLFLNFGTFITYVLADRLLRLNRLFKYYSEKELQLPKVTYVHDIELSLVDFLNKVIETNPYFNQWLITMLLPGLTKTSTELHKKSKDKEISEKKSKRKNVSQIFKKYISNPNLSNSEKIHQMRTAISYKFYVKAISILKRINKQNGEIVLDTNTHTTSSFFSILGFYWPFGNIALAPDFLPENSWASESQITRKLFQDEQEAVSKIFRNIFKECSEDIYLPDQTFSQLSRIISILLPKQTTEHIAYNTDFILKRFSPYKNKSYLCNGLYYSHNSALNLFASRELEMNTISMQHSAWGGYIANGPGISEILMGDNDYYITFGWNNKEKGVSNWLLDSINLPSPLLSSIKKPNWRKLPREKKVLISTGFLYRFPSIYSSFLRWDITDKWSTIIENVIYLLAKNKIKTEMIHYDSSVAINIEDYRKAWREAGGSYFSEFKDHNLSVRELLKSSSFRNQYDAIIWDLPAGGFSECYAYGMTSFALWNKNLIRCLPEAKELIDGLIAEGVLFENENQLLTSLNKFYKNKNHFNSFERARLMTYFSDNYFEISKSWKQKWKKALKGF